MIEISSTKYLKTELKKCKLNLQIAKDKYDQEVLNVGDMRDFEVMVRLSSVRYWEGMVNALDHAVKYHTGMQL